MENFQGSICKNDFNSILVDYYPMPGSWAEVDGLEGGLSRSVKG